MTAPVHLRREPHPGIFPAHIQGASPFRAIYFMSAESHQVDTILIHIYRDLAHRLSGIREETTPCCRAIRLISRIGWITPISLLAYIMAMRMVVGLIAACSSAGSISPSGLTGRYVTSPPIFSRRPQVSRTALCSVAAVMI